jgi:16S rRNA C967 or C1407 C5-methylase (RsmB/RsmF family)
VHVEVTCARSKGCVRSKFQRDRAWCAGVLQIGEQHDKELHRVVRVATLTQGGREVLPPLVDVQVVEMRPDWWVLTGFERIALGALVEPTAFQQSWFIVPKKG